jgi:hypothetical protein
MNLYVLVCRLSVAEQPKMPPIASGVDVMITIFGDFRQKMAPLFKKN